MFIITKKVHRGRLTASALLLALTLIVVGAGTFLAQDIQAAVAPAETLPDPTGVRSNEDRIAYLQSLGWIVGKEPAAVEDVLIPETFDASYNDYLALQAEMGFDLRDYTGKTVKRYTYQVKNYPGLQENIWVSLLIHKKTVIGGEVFCNQGDGFTQSLVYPVKTTQS
ncbi:DUF4830 domain-containing protein [Evtepia sp.]|uniref:DUF4830 domain-containing protein n=1 Tax=Evtepia sp. TaxID=2773933 RepID=UPI003F181BB5